MKIALTFPGCHRRGGVERIILECANYLAGRDHDVHLFSNDWDQSALHPAIKTHFVSVRKQPSFMRGASFFEECTRTLSRDDSFEVLNTHGCVCPTGGVQWVQSLHRAWLDQSKNFRHPMSMARWKQRLNPLHPVLLNLEKEHYQRRAYRKVAVTTEDVRNDLNRYYQVPKEDVVIIPNGFLPTEFNPERRQARRAAERERLGLKNDHVALLFVANELERKGYSTILGAMRRMARPELRLLVVGKPDVELVKQQAEAFGVAGQVIACGSTSDVAAYHAAGDVFVLPTQYEAFCLAILEALGSGLPVVTTRVPGAHNAIIEKTNGLLIADPKSDVQLAEALEQLTDRVTRERMSAAAPESVRQYQWPTVLQQYEKVLAENSR